MAEPSREELRAILRVSYDAAAASTVDAFRERSLAAARELVRTDLATYNEIDRGTGDVVVVTDPPNAFAPEAVEDFRRYAHEHPLITYYAETGDGRAHTISEFLDQDGFRSLDLYKTVFAPHGLEYQLAVTLPGAPTQLIGIALNRGAPDFDDRERRRLDLLRPHLAQAYALVREREAMRLQVRALDAALDAFAEGVVLVGPDGAAVTYSSGPARELLPETAAGALPDEVEAWLRRGAQGTLAVRGVSVRCVGDAGLGVLLVRRADALGAPAAALTPREIEILASVADGRTDAQIARDLGLSPRTVQHHLRNVFVKLDVHNRTAAVRRVFG